MFDWSLFCTYIVRYSSHQVSPCWLSLFRPQLTLHPWARWTISHGSPPHLTPPPTSRSLISPSPPPPPPGGASSASPVGRAAGAANSRPAEPTCHRSGGGWSGRWPAAPAPAHTRTPAEGARQDGSTVPGGAGRGRTRTEQTWVE